MGWVGVGGGVALGEGGDDKVAVKGLFVQSYEPVIGREIRWLDYDAIIGEFELRESYFTAEFFGQVGLEGGRFS